MTKKPNEKFIHNCGETKTKIEGREKSIVDMDFDDKELKEILDFYLFHSITVHDNKKTETFGHKSLQMYGWSGNADLSKLEGRLLRASNIGFFCFIKADSIEDTLDAMNLKNSICVEHPRAVLKQKYSVRVQENGEVDVSQKETRMGCLFRHIRNAFAHNCTYLFENNNILLEDSEENGKLSARILMPKQALVEWMKIIKKEDGGQNYEE